MSRFERTEDIDNAASRHVFEIEAFLRSKGWRHTSHTPAHLWLWERNINGRMILVERDTAVKMQAYLDKVTA